MTSVDFVREYDKFDGKLYAFAMKLTRNRDDANDLMQETAIRAYANRERFEMGTNFKSWMTTIMRNTFINKYRERKRKKNVEHPIENYTYAVESKTISGGAETVLMMEEMSNIIGTLNEKYRIPFLMFYKGYHYDEISEEMNIPIGTVKSRLSTARKMLKDAIAIQYRGAYPLAG